MQPETTYQAILGQMLKELRKNKGMDQADIAQKMAINPSSWSRIESGNTILNIRQLQKIGEMFGLEANEILLKADTIAHSLRDQGYIVHYDSIKEVQSKGSQGLALIGGAVLGLLVGRLLFGQDDKNNNQKDT